MLPFPLSLPASLQRTLTEINSMTDWREVGMDCCVSPWWRCATRSSTRITRARWRPSILVFWVTALGAPLSANSSITIIPSSRSAVAVTTSDPMDRDRPCPDRVLPSIRADPDPSFLTKEVVALDPLEFQFLDCDGFPENLTDCLNPFLQD